MKRLPPYTAMILAGGAARRMENQTDAGLKFLLKLGDTTLLDRITKTLQDNTHPPETIVLNLAQDQLPYAPPDYPLAIDRSITREGPLAGIAAGLTWCHDHASSHAWMLSLSGDTPFLPTDLGERLMVTALEQNAKIVYSRSGSRHHPTIALWHTSLLPSLLQALNNGVRKVDLFGEAHQFTFTEWDIVDHDPFFNINRPKDLYDANVIDQMMKRSSLIPEA